MRVEWLAELLLHGLLEASFVPHRKLREMRDLSCARASRVPDVSRVRNRIQKVLEDANIKPASVATDPFGVSARAMLARLIAGETDANRLAAMALGKPRKKIPELVRALDGRLREHHRFQLQLLWEK